MNNMCVQIQVQSGLALLPFDLTPRAHDIPSSRVYFSHHCFDVGITGGTPNVGWNELWSQVEVAYDNHRRPELILPQAVVMNDRFPLASTFKYVQKNLQPGQLAFFYGIRGGAIFRTLPTDPLLPAPVRGISEDWELLGVIDRGLPLTITCL